MSEQITRREEFSAILDSSYDGIHITNEKGITLYYNSACEKIEGIYKKDIIGKDLRNLVKEGLYEESLALKVIEKEEPITMMQTINGNDVMVTATPIFKDNKIIRVVANSRDITQLNILRKELEYTKKINERYHSELNLTRTEQLESDIIADDLVTKKIVDLAIHVANVDSIVLIQGESGVGKGVFSKLIHDNSRRKENTFVKIDVSAIPENLLEAELFGYEKGAFTGANENGRIGLIEFANGGTIFLDEIGEMPLSMQTKLLRVIQDRKIVRVGGNKEIPIDIRIIAATNKNLKSMIQDKTFREDLYYRLNVVPIVIPSLRERKKDIFPIIMKNLKKFNDKYNLQKNIQPEALDLLIRYDWPGNIRELENMIERLIVTVKNNSISITDIPLKINDNNLKKQKKYLHDFDESLSYREMMDKFEKNIFANLLKTNKKVSEISHVLEVDESTVRRKLKKHNLN